MVRPWGLDDDIMGDIVMKKYPGGKLVLKTKPNEWGQHQLAALLGIAEQRLGRPLAGLEYPSLHTMQKFEVVFGWPVSEQVALIPYLWEEPDLRYAMVLRQVINDWKANNPRTVRSTEVRMHPSLKSRHAIISRAANG